MKTKQGVQHGIHETAQVETVSTIDGLMTRTAHIYRELARVRQMVIERRPIDA